jgi:hypothetical protein
MSDVFNAKHLVLYTSDSSNDDANSRKKSLKLKEDDVDQITSNNMKKFEVKMWRSTTSFAVERDCRITFWSESVER